MTETMVPPESTAESRALVPVPSSEVVESPAADIDLADTVLLEAPIQDGLIVGRPVEDRAFEAAETALGMAAGATIGTVVAGPVGLVVGGVIGAAGGLIAGEARERHEGRVARTTDADPADADVPHLE